MELEDVLESEIPGAVHGEGAAFKGQHLTKKTECISCTCCSRMFLTSHQKYLPALLLPVPGGEGTVGPVTALVPAGKQQLHPGCWQEEILCLCFAFT